MSEEHTPPPPPPPRTSPRWEAEPEYETIRLSELAAEAGARPAEPSAMPRRSIWPWVALGLGAGLFSVLLLGGALLLLLPALREELLLRLSNPQPVAAPPPEQLERPSPGAPAGLPQISDSFDAPSSLWEISSSQINNGSYELRTDTPNYDSYGLFLGGGEIGNLDLTVAATQTEGPLDAEYGIRFRQPGPENYMMFAISSGGYYRLLRVSEGQFSSLTPWTFSPRIRTGLGATNALRVVAEGSLVRAWINGHQVLTYDDPELRPGQLGLGVTAFAEGGVVVRFDDIVGSAEGVGVDESFDSPEAAPWSVGGSRIENGVYEMHAGTGLSILQQPQPPGSSRARDWTLEVDAALVEGANEGAGYGVLFGYSENFQYYGLLILGDGRIALTAPGSPPQVSPEALPAVKTGPGELNRIRVEAREGRLTVAINGETVIDVEGVELEEGEVGMLISSGDAGRAVAQFDNFRFEAGGTRT
jgi:hypothetical protein